MRTLPRAEALFERVLIPLDGSELATRIFEHAGPIIHRAETITLLRVVDPDTRLDAAQVELDAEVLRLRREGHDAHAVVRAGDPATEIEELARRERSSLVALSTHGRTGMERFLRGSVAETVLRRATAPLLLANPNAAPPVTGLRRILVPIDGTEAGTAILPLVGAFARATNAEVILQTVVVPPRTEPLLTPVLASTEDASARLEGLRPRLNGVRIRLVAEIGPAVETILARAAEEQADLIALTTRGRGGAARWVLGSVAEEVLRRCRCPVLVRRASREGGDRG